MPLFKWDTSARNCDARFLLPLHFFHVFFSLFASKFIFPDLFPFPLPLTLPSTLVLAFKAILRVVQLARSLFVVSFELSQFERD